MRRIERTNQFKRDYKRESRGRHRTDLECREPLSACAAGGRLVSRSWSCNRQFMVLLKQVVERFGEQFLKAVPVLIEQ